MRTIVIADDHPITLMGMKSFIQKLGYEHVETFENGIAAFNHIISKKPDYAILDLSMPGMSGLEILEKVRSQNKTIKIIIYTMYNEQSLFDKAVRLKVNGYLLKEFALEEMEACLESLRFKKEYFSARLTEKLIIQNDDEAHLKTLKLTAAELKIAQLISEGKMSKEIAILLFISEKTVENHRSNIMKKLALPKKNNSLSKWAIENRELLQRCMPRNTLLRDE